VWRRRLKKGAKIPQRSSSRRGCILRFPLSEVTRKRCTEPKGYTTPVFCTSVQFSGDRNNHWCTHLSLSSSVLYMQMQQKSIRNNINCCCRRNRKRIAAFVKIAIFFCLWGTKKMVCDFDRWIRLSKFFRPDKRDFRPAL